MQVRCHVNGPYKLVVYLLVCGLFLQSCGNSNLSIPNATIGEPTVLDISKELDRESLAVGEQKKLIPLSLSRLHQPYHIYVGNRGILGGMKEGNEDREEKPGKKKVKTKKKNKGQEEKPKKKKGEKELKTKQRATLEVAQNTGLDSLLVDISITKEKLNRDPKNPVLRDLYKKQLVNLQNHPLYQPSIILRLSALEDEVRSNLHEEDDNRVQQTTKIKKEESDQKQKGEQLTGLEEQKAAKEKAQNQQERDTKRKNPKKKGEEREGEKKKIPKIQSNSELSISVTERISPSYPSSSHSSSSNMIKVGIIDVPRETLSLEYCIKEKAYLQLLEREVLPYLEKENKQPPSCFITYAWGEHYYEFWVRRFCEMLNKARIKVLLDRWTIKGGNILTEFIENSIEKADWVIVVGTKLYLQKYNKRVESLKVKEHVARLEGQLIDYLIRYSTEMGNKVIPILLEGTSEESLPFMLRHKIAVEFTKGNYFEEILKLIRDLYKINNRNKRFEGFIEKFRQHSSAIAAVITPEERKEYEAKRTAEILESNREILEDIKGMKEEALNKSESLLVEGASKQPDLQIGEIGDYKEAKEHLTTAAQQSYPSAISLLSKLERSSGGLSKKIHKSFNPKALFKNILSGKLLRGYKMGETYDREDSFFDALAQSINMLSSSDHTAKDLRMFCFLFYEDNTELVNTWNQEYSVSIKREKDIYKNVQYTSEERKKYFKDQYPIYGHPEVEGKILCRKLNLEHICVIKLAEYPEELISFYLIDKDQYQPIGPKAAGKLMRKHNIPALTLVNTHAESYFLPLLKRKIKEKSKEEVELSRLISSLDEGKIRSVLEAFLSNYLEEKLEEKIKEQSKLRNEDTPALHLYVGKWFNLIVSTVTGRIIMLLCVFLSLQLIALVLNYGI